MHKKILRLGRSVMMALSFVLLSTAANAFSGDATDNAFAALLSMPGAEPEQGYWDFPKPEDLPAANETTLIAYLAKQLKAGADPNAYRHLGTLLHHAIRAGQQRTAIWLLAHGADPRKTLQGGTDTALTLGVRYKRKKVLQALKSTYGLVPDTTPASSAKPPPQPVDARRIASLTFGSPADDKLARDSMRRLAISVTSYNPQPDQVAASEAAVGQWTALAARLSPQVYARIMDDDQAMSDLVLMHSRSAAGLDAALAGVPAPVLQRRVNAAVRGLAQRAALLGSSGDALPAYGLAPELWRTLWRHLPRPIDYTEWPSLAGRIQPELWSELFASGYANRDANTALQCAPAEMGAKAFEAAWPFMLAQFGNARDNVPITILSQFRLVGSQYPDCATSSEADTREKLLFLASHGVARPLRGLDAKRVAAVAKSLVPAVGPFIDNTTPGKPRLVDAQANCTFELTDTLYRELLNHTTVTANRGDVMVRVETVQLVEIPGDTRCGLLVGGSSQVDGYVGGLVDTFTGPENNPTPSCPDPSDGYEVWREHDGKVERLNTDMGGDDGVPRLMPVQDTVTGRRYYLHDGMQYGRCHGALRLPFTFEWKSSAQGPALMKTTAFPELEEALYAQCSVDDKAGVRCNGISALNAVAPSAAASTPKDAFNSLDLQTFLKVFRKTQFDDYQAAVRALDRPRLQAFKTAGVPGPWTAEAIKSLARSDLSQAERRRRIAWLFADHDQLARALDNEVLASLADWLPREDWGPILGVVTSHRDVYYGLGYLRAGLAEKKRDALACDIDRAQGLMCGETWGADH